MNGDWDVLVTGLNSVEGLEPPISQWSATNFTLKTYVAIYDPSQAHHLLPLIAVSFQNL